MFTGEAVSAIYHSHLYEFLNCSNFFHVSRVGSLLDKYLCWMSTVLGTWFVVAIGTSLCCQICLTRRIRASSSTRHLSTTHLLFVPVMCTVTGVSNQFLRLCFISICFFFWFYDFPYSFFINFCSL